MTIESHEGSIRGKRASLEAEADAHTPAAEAARRGPERGGTAAPLLALLVVQVLWLGGLAYLIWWLVT